MRIPSARSFSTSLSDRFRYAWITVPTELAFPGSAVEFVHEIQGALRVGRTFHIDAHKAGRVHGCGLGDQSADDFAGQLLVHIQPHVSELEADVGVEFVGGDGIENLMIELGAWRASSGLVTFSPRLSMLTLMPARLTACVERTASAISVPATKRPETRRPSAERSANVRKDGFSERRTKNALNMPHLESRKPQRSTGR